jgi:hypothetical protein
MADFNTRPIQPMPSGSANTYPPAVAHAYPWNANSQPQQAIAPNVADDLNGESTN